MFFNKKLLLFVVFFLSSCGQKGDLFLEDKVFEDKTSVISTVNKKREIIPVLKELGVIRVSGQEVRISGNTSNNWRASLSDTALKDNGIRYILLKSSLLRPKNNNYKFLVGKTSTLKKDGYEVGIVPSGSYLVFRSFAYGYEEIPSLILDIKEYFRNSKIYNALDEDSFMVDENKKVDIYIKVEKKND